MFFLCVVHRAITIDLYTLHHSFDNRDAGVFCAVRNFSKCFAYILVFKRLTHMAHNALFYLAPLYVVIFSYNTQRDSLNNKEATDI